MDTCGHVGWQIKSTNKNNKPKPQRAKRRSPSQICASPSSRETKQKANGAGPNKNNHNQDLPRTQWRKATVSQLTKRCTKRISCCPESETRFWIVVADRQQGKALAVHHCILASQSPLTSSCSGVWFKTKCVCREPNGGFRSRKSKL